MKPVIYYGLQALEGLNRPEVSHILNRLAMLLGSELKQLEFGLLCYHRRIAPFANFVPPEP